MRPLLRTTCPGISVSTHATAVARRGLPWSDVAGAVQERSPGPGDRRPLVTVSLYPPAPAIASLSILPDSSSSPINSATVTRREQYYEPTTVWTSSSVTRSRFSVRVDMPLGNSKLCLNPIKYTKLSLEPPWRFTAIRGGHLTAMVQIFIVGWRNIVTLKRLTAAAGV